MKRLVNAFLVPLGVALATAAPAAADHQPMAMGAQVFELAANGEHEVPAFCRDHDLVVPGARTQLGNVAGATIEVCNKAGSCLRLPEAIAGGWIRVRGTGDYRVRFENLTKGSLSIKVGEGAIVSDAPVTDTRPFSFKLPVDRYDPFTGYRGWRELGQVGAIQFVTVVEHPGRFAITGQDKLDASPALVLEDIAEADLGATIAKLELSSRVMFVFDANLDPSKVCALLHDVRLQAAKDGLIAAIRPDTPEFAALEKLGDVKVGAKSVEVSAKGRRVEGSLELESASEPGRTVPVRAIVELQRPAPPTLRAKVGEAVRRGIDRLRGKRPASLLETATGVRDAVRDEVRALRRNLSASVPMPEDAVWVLIGNQDGVILGRITLQEAPWEG